MKSSIIANIPTRQIYDAALAAARAVAPGALFIGAFGEADKAGYPRDSIEFDLFVALFLNHLPARITTNDAGIIIRVG